MNFLIDVSYSPKKISETSLESIDAHSCGPLRLLNTEPITNGFSGNFLNFRTTNPDNEYGEMVLIFLWH